MQFFQTILLAALALLPGAFAATAGDIVPGSYIVILKEGITTQEFSAHRAFANDLQSAALSKRDSGHAGVRHTYNFAKLKGYSGTFDDAAIKQIASRTDVAYVEADRVVTANAIVSLLSEAISKNIRSDISTRSLKSPLPAGVWDVSPASPGVPPTTTTTPLQEPVLLPTSSTLYLNPQILAPAFTC